MSQITLNRYECVTSTMDVARQLAQQGCPHGTWAVARQQTAGRGRRGRDWFSPAASNWYGTGVLRPAAHSDLHTLSLVAGVAVWQVFADMGVGQQVALKWPNDLMVGERKLSGVLLERQDTHGQEPCVLVGIGINIVSRQQLQIPHELAERYTGLLDLLIQTPQHIFATLTQLVPQAIAKAYMEWCDMGLQPFLQRWQQVDALLGQYVRIQAPSGQNGDIIGMACGIAHDGALQVRTAQGDICLQAGEVVCVRANGPVKPSEHAS